MARTANAERGEVALVVGTKTYVLRPVVQHIVAMERRAEKAYGTLLDEALREVSYSAMVELLWAYLQAYHASEFANAMAIYELMDQLDGKHRAVTTVFMDLINLNKPSAERLKAAQKRAKREGGEPPDPPGAQAGSGSDSGATPGASA